MRVLFTKKLDNIYLHQHLNKNIVFDSLDFIQEEKVSLNAIKSQIPQDFTKAIVTSLRGAKAIRYLNSTSDFYCVGEKAANFLIENNYKIKIVELNAEGLVNAIKTENLPSQQFIYYCSNLRQDVIKLGLEALGHDVIEVISYTITEKPILIDRDYDCYVFFSPSGVKSFFKENQIPKEASIFAIGSTTAIELKNYSSTEILIPETPTLDSLLNFINITHYA